ncbi:MAG: alanine racemase [Bacteroidetes bacterium]|jgi:D-serine deaminase-like pyridoxal phosphate-dependent protein|nr:alanine racemase [Bacteroidota bacterium]
MSLSTLPTPSLLLDSEILERNLQRMQDRADRMKVRLRPHLKTHKCLQVARWQEQLGAQGVTVSTFYEAKQFAAAGFSDILWAFPLPPVYATRVAELADEVTLRVVIDSVDAMVHLEQAARAAHRDVHTWLKVDCGNHRAGVDPSSPLAEQLVRTLNESTVLLFDGILSHSGHAYHGRNRAEILAAAQQERDIMVEFAGRVRAKGYRVPAISVGSTPAASVIDHYEGVDEMRPGNYVFHDYTMAMLGVCGVEDCALTVLSSVISHQPGAKHVITDAGALALSKDLGPTHLANPMGMGPIFEDYDRKRLHAHIHMGPLSQEHGKLVAEAPASLDGLFAVGDRVRVLEHHSCLAVPNHDEYIVVRDGEIVDRWPILKGRSV